MTISKIILFLTVLFVLFSNSYSTTRTVTEFTQASFNAAGIGQFGNDVPKNYKLEQNYPNPFNPSTNIRFDIPGNAEVKLIVYDLIGNQQAVLIDKDLKAGSYSVDWDASEFPSGVYFYRLITPGYTTTKKMILIK